VKAGAGQSKEREGGKRKKGQSQVLGFPRHDRRRREATHLGELVGNRHHSSIRNNPIQPLLILQNLLTALLDLLQIVQVEAVEGDAAADGLVVELLDEVVDGFVDFGLGAGKDEDAGAGEEEEFRGGETCGRRRRG
jgi:hypothetical protein